MNENICSNLSVIPQFKNHTWFNAILMCCFYSQMMRKLMINKVSKTWKKTSNLFKFLKTVLKKNYKTNEESMKLISKIKPDMLLLTILFKYDFKMINKWKVEWNITYISLLLKFLNVKVLDITYFNNETLLFNYGKILNNYLLYSKEQIFLLQENKDKPLIIPDQYKEIVEIAKIIYQIPDVLVVYHKDINNTIKNSYDYYNSRKELEVFNFFKYQEYLAKNFPNIFNEINDIKELKEQFYFNGNLYKLDSVLLDNYNGGKYSIAGIHCNNEKYVYNGWYNNKCKLLNYNWNLKKNNEFCFNNNKCKMEEVNILKRWISHCFSFNKGDRVLIYVKDNNDKSTSIKSKSHFSLSSS